MSLNKVSVDSAAKDYWTEYYKEYGKAWVRDIKKRVKTAMAQTRKVASSEVEPGKITPIAATLSEGVATVEGVFETQAGAKLLFQASFDSDGNTVSFDTVPLVTAK